MNVPSVLIVRVSAMGDVIHTLPAVAALREAHPTWRIDWIVDERWAPLLIGDGPPPVVTEAFAAPVRAWKAAPISLATMRSFRSFSALRGRYDLVLDVQGTLRSATIAWLARGHDGVCGFADPREPLARQLYRKTLKRTGTHVVEQNTAMLSAAAGEVFSPAVFALPHAAWADEWAITQAQRGPLCVLCPSAGWGAKQWPQQHFARLARELHACGFDVAVSAPRKDDPVATAVVETSLGSARMIVCNVTGIIALLRHAALVIGGDTGPVHIAAALARPVVALFGPTNPERNGPWGAGPMRVLRRPESLSTYHKSSEPDPGLTLLSVEQVMAAMDELGL
jgi:heptosyltransferase-1